MDQAELSRWKKAVVNLECARDSVHYEARQRLWEKLIDQQKRGEITNEQMSDRMSLPSRDIRCWGTAVFVKHEGRRFLVTARHVLYDEATALQERKAEEHRRKEQNWPDNEHLREYEDQRYKRQIFKIVFRVPTLDEANGAGTPQENLMNLQAGVYDSGPYTFSDEAIDLAVVSLDNRDSRFADEMEARGYVALPSSDIADSPSIEGADVFTVGFPGATSKIGRVELSRAEENWASSAVCLPTFSFGKVAMVHSALEMFYCDLTVNPGNSGGPIVEAGKLVGIVHAQPMVELEFEGVEGIEGRAGVPFAQGIKGEHVLTLLQEQYLKDTEDAATRYRRRTPGA